MPCSRTHAHACSTWSMASNGESFPCSRTRRASVRTARIRRFAARITWAMTNVLDDSIESRIEARDREGRLRAVDPRYNVALEACAGMCDDLGVVTHLLNTVL